MFTANSTIKASEKEAVEVVRIFMYKQCNRMANAVVNRDRCEDK